MKQGMLVRAKRNHKHDSATNPEHVAARAKADGTTGRIDVHNSDDVCVDHGGGIFAWWHPDELTAEADAADLLAEIADMLPKRARPEPREHREIIADLKAELDRLRAVEAIRVDEVESILAKHAAAVGAVGPMPKPTGAEPSPGREDERAEAVRRAFESALADDPTMLSRAWQAVTFAADVTRETYPSSPARRRLVEDELRRAPADRTPLFWPADSEAHSKLLALGMSEAEAAHVTPAEGAEIASAPGQIGPGQTPIGRPLPADASLEARAKVAFDTWFGCDDADAWPAVVRAVDASRPAPGLSWSTAVQIAMALAPDGDVTEQARAVQRIAGERQGLTEEEALATAGPLSRDIYNRIGLATGNKIGAPEWMRDAIAAALLRASRGAPAPAPQEALDHAYVPGNKTLDPVTREVFIGCLKCAHRESNHARLTGLTEEQLDVLARGMPDVVDYERATPEQRRSTVLDVLAAHGPRPSVLGASRGEIGPQPAPEERADEAQASDLQARAFIARRAFTSSGLWVDVVRAADASRPPTIFAPWTREEARIRLLGLGHSASEVEAWLDQPAAMLERLTPDCVEAAVLRGVLRGNASRPGLSEEQLRAIVKATIEAKCAQGMADMRVCIAEHELTCAIVAALLRASRGETGIVREPHVDVHCARCDKPVGETAVREGEDVLCLPCSIDDLDGRDLDRSS